MIKPRTSIKIEQVANGYVVTPVGDLVGLSSTIVFNSCNDTYLSNDLLRFIKDHFTAPLELED